MVFLHGLGARGLTFYNQMMDLRKDYQCLAFDLRGFGKSVRLYELPCSVSSYVEDIRGALLKLGIKDKVVLVGHSFGGMIALQYAITYKNEVEKLVIIGSASSIKHSTLSSFGMAVFSKVKPALKNERVKVIYATKINIYSKVAKKELIDWLEQEAKNTSSEVIDAMSRIAQKIREWSVDEELSQINIPTIIFRGEKDMLITKKATDFLHQKIPSSSYVIIKETGHCPTFEKPNIFNLVLRKFLKDEPLKNLPSDVYIVPRKN